MRQKLRHLYLSLAGRIAAPSPGIHILNSHFISRSNSNAKRFENQVSKLKKRFSFLRIEEAVHLLTCRKVVKHPCLSFTYDDGFEECYTQIAPVLEKFDTNAAFFVNPGFIDGDEGYKQNFTNSIVKTPGKRPMSWLQIVALHSAGHIIGSHTFDHIDLDNKNQMLLEYQIKESKSIIEKEIKAKCEYFAYPFGQKNNLSELALSIAKENHKYLFSGFGYHKYFSFDDKVINRRHCEGDWPISHVNYFLSTKRSF